MLGMDNDILTIENIRVRYSRLPVIHGVSMAVKEGEMICVLGSNGAGKSTILRAVMGAQSVYEGKILFRGEEIHKLRTEQIVHRGIIYVPEEKMLFNPLPVEENLLLGAYIIRDKQQVKKNLQAVYQMFPILSKRRKQPASTLSGGEQQMVAIGRALMSNPEILMLDEPSLGLAPLMVDEVFETIKRLKGEGITILLVEQNVREAIELADRGYVLQTGKVVLHGTPKELLESEMFKSAFLGI